MGEGGIKNGQKIPTSFMDAPKALCVLLLLDKIRLRKKAFTRQKEEEKTSRCLLGSDLFNLSICAKLDALQFFLEANFNSAK